MDHAFECGESSRVKIAHLVTVCQIVCCHLLLLYSFIHLFFELLLSRFCFGSHTGIDNTRTLALVGCLIINHQA